MRYRIECRFVDIGVAYIEAASQTEAGSKADELGVGEFLIDDKANMADGEIISVVALVDTCCPEGTSGCSDEPGHAGGRARFLSMYREKLAEAVVKHPNQYGWPIEELDTVMGRMIVALENGTFSMDGLAFRNTCRALGIKHTYKAINEFISEGGQS